MTFEAAIEDYLMQKMPVGKWVVIKDLKLNGVTLSDDDYIGFIMIAADIIENDKLPRGYFLSFKDDWEQIKKTSFWGFSNKLKYEHKHRKNGKSEEK